MKVTIDKCEHCGALYDDEAAYTKHLETHQALIAFDAAFPKVKDDDCDFANGGWNIQRSKKWLNNYKKAILEAIGNITYKPFSYRWFRCLDDGNYAFYGRARRTLNICPKCYREWGQAYHANHCNCTELMLGQHDEVEGLQEIDIRNDDGSFCPKLYAVCYEKDDIHYEDDQAFAQQVIRACNNHDALLAALERAYFLLETNEIKDVYFTTLCHGLKGILRDSYVVSDKFVSWEDAKKELDL